MLGAIPRSPGNGVDVGPLFVHAYGLMYAVAVVAAIAITQRRWVAVGGERSLVEEVAMWAFPAGIVGARLYYLLTSWDQVPDDWWGPLAIWEGGLGLWGGIAAGTLAGLAVLRRRRADVAGFLDAAAPGLLVAQAIGRVGNYFNEELFGGPTSLPWALHISPEHRPDAYLSSATFHPTFLYELVWDLVLAGALVLISRRRRVRAPGLFALYVAGYSFVRIGVELLRVDPAHRILGMRLNFWVATLVFASGVAWFARTRRGGTHGRRVATLLLAGTSVAFWGCGADARRADARAATSSAAVTHVATAAARCAWPCAPKPLAVRALRASRESRALARRRSSRRAS